MKKVISTFLALVIVGSLCACNAPAPTPTGSPSPSSDTQTAPKEEKIKLVAPKLGYNDTQIATAKKNAADQNKDLLHEDKYYISVRESIERDYPNYDVDYADWGWAEQLDQKQRTLLTSGDAPSLVAGETFMPTYANEGILSPLPQDIVDSVNPSFLIYDKDNKPVAVAYKASIFMLFYNKDLLQKAGLDPETPPKTWAEWQKASEAVTKAGSGQFYGGGVPSFPHIGGALRATPFFRQLATDFAKDGKPNLMDENVKTALEFIRTMNANFPQGLGNNTNEEPMWNAFEKDQNIAFVVNGSWEAFNATRHDVNWGVAPLPLPEGGEVGNCMVGAVYLAVPKAAKNQDACFNLIRKALDPDNLIHYIHETTPPALKSIIEDPAVYEGNETLSVAMKALQDATYTGLVSFPKNDSQIWEIINQQVLSRVTMTNDPIDTICAEAQAKIEALLE